MILLFSCGQSNAAIIPLYSASEYSNYVASYDPFTGQEQSSFNVGRDPSALAFDSLGNLFFASQYSNYVASYDPFTGQEQSSFNVGRDPSALAFDSLGNLFVASQYSNFVASYDPFTGQEQSSFNVGRDPNALAFYAVPTPGTITLIFPALFIMLICSRKRFPKINVT